MSEEMYFEVPVNDTKTVYTVGDWREYAIHDSHNIKGFFGDYRWMSNFHVCDVYYEGLLYRSTEAAYQAAKLLPHLRSPFQTAKPAETKKLWKKFDESDRYDACPSEWDTRKYNVMAAIVFDKFMRHKELADKLLATGEKYIEELNHWSDIFWGVDIKKGGQNRLGKILMNTRRYLKYHEMNISEPLPLEDRR